MPMSASRIFFARCSSKGWWGNVDHHYLLPLAQVELGDALGISEVYANRMLRRLQDEKLIVSERRTMRIPDLEALKAAAAFDHATSTWTARCRRCGIRSRRRAGCHSVRQSDSGPYRPGTGKGRRRRSRVNIFFGAPPSVRLSSGQAAEHREADPRNGGGAEPNRSSSAGRIRARFPAVHRFARSNLGCSAGAH